MSDAAVVLERRGPAAILTLNRPARMNALGRELVEGLERGLADAANDDACRAIVVTGAGDRAFCAGADLKEREGMTEPEVRAFVARLQALADLLETGPLPVIAAVNGVALGGGLELALACDLRVFATEAIVGLTEVRLGIIPGAGGTQRLGRLIGHGRARELILTGRRIDAESAAAMGIANHVVPRSDLLDRALALVDEISLGAPLAIQAARTALLQGMQADLRTGLAIERLCYERVLPTDDRREALAAFREKRPPVFRGR